MMSGESFTGMVMDGRCETCTWWGKLPGYDENFPWEHAPSNWRACLRLHRDHWIDDPIPDSKAIIEGYEWYGVATAPDFGCVQWEAKE
jgi:hypothetical protein